MPSRELLESYPLYRKFKMTLPDKVNDLEKPSIHVECPVCRSAQTFNMVGLYYDNPYVIPHTRGAVVPVVYQCASCTKSQRHFMLKFDPEGLYVMKIGQDPPWEITPDRDLAKSLGQHVDYYKKGLVCESQSYGIGAFAYYRRIVEEVIDKLLGEIPDLMAGDDKERYLAAYEKVKQTKVAEEKIKLVKDLLPAVLRPEGMNPLAVLHDALSEGLHSQPDDRCIELAANIREILEAMTTQIATSKAQSKRLTSSMRKLLERKKDAVAANPS